MRDWEGVRPYFERAAVVHLATLLPDGAPHTVPVWMGVEGDELAFFTAAGSLKDRNLQADPRLAVSVTHPQQPLDMAFARGTVTRRVEGDEALAIVDRIAHVYTGGPYPERDGFVAYLVRPTTLWANDYTEA